MARRKDLTILELSEIIIDDELDVRYKYGEIQELASSIESIGVLIPIIVKKEKGEDRYTVLDGHRRIKAIEYLAEAGIGGIEIPARKVAVDYTKEDALIDIITHNSSKELEPLEEAEILGRIYNGEDQVAGVSAKWTLRNLATRIGKSHVHVSNRIKLYGLSESSKEAIKKDQISITLVLDTIKDKGVEAVDSLIAKAVHKAQDEQNPETPIQVDRADLAPTEKKVKPSKLDEVTEMLKAVTDVDLSTVQDEEQREKIRTAQMFAETHVTIVERIQKYLLGDIKAEDIYENYTDIIQNAIQLHRSGGVREHSEDTELPFE